MSRKDRGVRKSAGCKAMSQLSKERRGQEKQATRKVGVMLNLQREAGGTPF